MQAKRRRAARSRNLFWFALLLGCSAGFFYGLAPSSASTPGLPLYIFPNVTSFTPAPGGGVWSQVQTEPNACPPDCSHDNILSPPGYTDALNGAPRYAGVGKAGIIVWAPGTNGYWVVDQLGNIYSQGGAPTLCEGKLSACSGFHSGDYWNITAAAADPRGRGLWAVGRDGAVWTASVDPSNSLPSYGDAQNSGGAATGIAAAPDGSGYCISISDGGVYCRGENDSTGTRLYHGSHPSTREDITGIAFYIDASQQVRGYWLVAQDGGVFSFDAPFWGSTGGNGSRFITSIVSFPLPGAKPGQEGGSVETRGYAWINQDGRITVAEPARHRSR